ncbi:MAG: hypothetical protein AAGB05_01935 [Pseudomonadota bacterium]
MPCFCNTTLTSMTPTARLSVRAVPPQLKNLLALLDLKPIEGPRIDEQLGEALPPGGQSWLQATLSAQMPGFAFPLFPSAGMSLMMTAALKLSVAATLFPLTDPRALLAQLQQAVLSMAQNLAPQMRPLLALPQPSLSNMALAARLTLALRAKGIDPMTLTGVNVNARFAATMPSYHAAMAISANFAGAAIPPFALPGPQLALAQNLATMAAVGTPGPGMPALTDPNFISKLKAMMQMLAKMPMPQLKIPAALPAVMADLDVILEAFGEDALTQAGILRVNAMLNILASWQIPLPLPAAQLSAQLNATPPFPAVMSGMKMAASAGASFGASANLSFGIPPILDLMELLATLSALLTKTLKAPPFCGNVACTLPLDDIAANLANVSVPEVPGVLLS